MDNKRYTGAVTEFDPLQPSEPHLHTCECDMIVKYPWFEDLPLTYQRRVVTLERVGAGLGGVGLVPGLAAPTDSLGVSFDYEWRGVINARR